MASYIFKRLLLMIPTLLGMTFMLFVVVRMAPGLSTGGGKFAAGTIRSQQAQKAESLFVKRELHMVDRNGKPIGLARQYFIWIDDLIHGNLGYSTQYNQPVINLIEQRLPVTLAINFLSIIIVYLVAVPGGMLAAVKQQSFADRCFGFVSLALYSLPIIWVGSMMLGLLANPQKLNWFPSAGIHSTNTSNMTYFQYVWDYCWHITLPVICLSYGSFAYLAKQVRGSILENYRMDYVRTARAKGLPESAVLLRHILRNSLLPLVTIVGMTLPGLLGGSVIVEQIFSIDGMGKLAYSATYARDLPMIQTISLIGAVLMLIAYLLVDICYAALDPRVSYA